MSDYQNAARAAKPYLNAGDHDLKWITTTAIQVLIDSNSPPVLFTQDARAVRVVTDGAAPARPNAAQPSVMLTRTKGELRELRIEFVTDSTSIPAMWM